MSDQTDVLPNLLVIGPTKSGTTSFSIYINQHPDVFVPEVKEPHFLASQIIESPLRGAGSDEVEAGYVKSLDGYKELYRGRKEKVICDASADTIYYGERIIPVIREYLGNPKIIILLRDPVKRAFSAYSHLIRDNREPLTFEKALQEEENRIRENYDPLFFYTACSFYADSVKSFRDAFTDVKILFTGDMYRDPDKFFKSVFEFLNVDPDFQVNTGEQHNMSGKPRSQALSDFVSRENKLRDILRPLIRLVTTKSMRERVANSIQKANLQKLEMAKETEDSLRQLFKPDIQKLEKELGKDLSSWYSGD